MVNGPLETPPGGAKGHLQTDERGMSPSRTGHHPLPGTGALCRRLGLPCLRGLLAPLVIALLPATAAANSLELNFHEKRNLVGPNAPLVVDLVETPSPELIVTDVRGGFRLYDAMSGRGLERLRIGEEILTAPAVGDFFGNDSLDVALATGSGRIMLLRGTSLDLIAESTIGAPMSLPPTVYTRELPEGSYRDRLLLADQDGIIRAVELTDEGALRAVWDYRTGTKLQAPMTIGSVRPQTGTDAVATTSDGYVIVLDPENSSSADREHHYLPESSAIPFSALLVDTDGSGNKEIIVTLASQKVVCLSYREGRTPAIQRVWERSLPHPAVAPPLLISRQGNPSEQYILQLSTQSLSVLDPVDGRVHAVDRSPLTNIVTEPALIPRPGRFPEIAWAQHDKSVHLTRNMTEWLDAEGSVTLDTAETRLGHQLTGTLVSYTEGPGEPYHLLGISPDQAGQIYSLRTGFVSLEGLWPTRTPWMTAGGNSARAGRLDLEAAMLEDSRRNVRAELANSWRTELDEHIAGRQWAQAAAISRQLYEYNPYNPEYRRLRAQVFIRRFLLPLIAGTIALLGLGVFTTHRTVRYLTNRRLWRRARASLIRGDHAEARVALERLRERKPDDPRVAAALAYVAIHLEDYSRQLLPVFRDACEARPEDRKLLHGLARCHLHAGDRTPEGAEVYEKALPDFPDAPRLEYQAGLCEMERANWEEAGRRFRAALKGGLNSDALYRSLCDVYLRTRNYTARTLPVFQQQYPFRKEEPEFLEGYLLACIDARNVDAQVEDLCRQVLGLYPGHAAASLHLAGILMQRGQASAATGHVRAALRNDPEHRPAVQLLADCYMMQHRRDEEAVAAYFKAAELDLAGKDILRVLAQHCFEQERFDPQALEIYNKSIAHNPGDPVTLRALASAADRNGDVQLAIRSLEALQDKAQLDKAGTLQLARAYIAAGTENERTDRILREALRYEPGEETLLAALVRVLAARGVDNPAIIPYVEQYLTLHPADTTAGRLMARATIRGERYEQALNVLQRFLAGNPGDEEFQRLHALASLYDNRVDAAITEYEQLLERNPDDREALINVALACAGKMRTDSQAEQYYHRALAIEPGHDRLHLALARVAAERNDPAAAAESYKQALKSRPGTEQAVLAHLEALLADRPELLRLRWFLVELLVGQGHLSEAIEQLETVGRHHPGQQANILRALDAILKRESRHASALAFKGRLLLESDNVQDAVTMLGRAYDLQPASPDIQETLLTALTQSLNGHEEPAKRFKLGKLHYLRQEYDEAIGCFQRTAQDHRWESESTKMLGRCFVDKGMLDLALQEYRKLAVDEETKELLYDLAQRYEAKRDLVGAKTVYRQLFAVDIRYRDVKTRFEMLSGSTSDPIKFDKTITVSGMSDKAQRRYELLDELGRGAMGIVYRARDKELDEVVALKILPDNLSNNPEAVRRFKVEARNARRLSHQHIVRIHDIGEEMGRKYISMEFVDGEDLKQRLRTAPGGKIPLGNALTFSLQILDALFYAHGLGIVHRDVKPANIMLTAEGQVKVTDFGIAKMVDATGEGTIAGAIIGTPLYMSPEQVRGLPVDHRADIYGFGVLLYEMLSGRPPFTEGDLAYQHLHELPGPLEDIPGELWQILERCLAKDREDRWENASALREALETATAKA